jgi:thiol:disulfide interchange protein DsbD
MGNHHLRAARGYLLVFLLALSVTWTASAQLETKTLLTPSIVADTESVAPGKPFTVGLVLKMASGWHTYWEYPGDAGQALKVDWTLPDGFTAGPIQWPIPHAHLDEGDLLSYTYEEEVLLPVQITPPAQAPPGDVTLKADLRWLVCEKTCIPGKGSVALTLHTGGQPLPANADL